MSRLSIHNAHTETHTSRVRSEWNGAVQLEDVCVCVTGCHENGLGTCVLLNACVGVGGHQSRAEQLGIFVDIHVKTRIRVKQTKQQKSVNVVTHNGKSDEISCEGIKAGRFSRIIIFLQF